MGFMDFGALLNGVAKEASVIRTERHEKENAHFMQSTATLNALIATPGVPEETKAQARRAIMDISMEHMGYKKQGANKNPVRKAMQGLLGDPADDYSSQMSQVGVGRGNAKTQVGGIPPTTPVSEQNAPSGAGGFGPPPEAPNGMGADFGPVDPMGYTAEQSAQLEGRRASIVEEAKKDAAITARLKRYTTPGPVKDWFDGLSRDEQKRLMADAIAGSNVFQGSVNAATGQVLSLETLKGIYANNPEALATIDAWPEGVKYGKPLYDREGHPTGLPQAAADPKPPAPRLVNGVLLPGGGVGTVALDPAALAQGRVSQLPGAIETQGNYANTPQSTVTNTDTNPETGATTTRTVRQPATPAQLKGSVPSAPASVQPAGGTTPPTSSTAPPVKDTVTASAEDWAFKGMAPKGDTKTVTKIQTKMHELGLSASLPVPPAMQEKVAQALEVRNSAIQAINTLDKNISTLNSIMDAGKIQLATSPGTGKLIITRLLPLTDKEAEVAVAWQALSEHINLLRGPLGATGFRSEESWEALQAQRGRLMADPRITKGILKYTKDNLLALNNADKMILGGFVNNPTKAPAATAPKADSNTTIIYMK